MRTDWPDDVAGAIAAASRALGLSRPEVMRLAGGAANRSYRLREGSHDFVLRLSGAAAQELGASRDSDVAMQALAAGAGLAPPVVLEDAAGRFVVSRHASGRSPTGEEMRDPRWLRRIGAWMARLHALAPPPGLATVDFGERAARLLARAAAGRADGLVPRLQRELARRRAALPPPERLCACHHDLHRRNLFDDGERILAVDWEYAGPGDPAADLAACAGYAWLSAGGSDSLLSGYGATPELRARAAELDWIFNCLWYAWNAAAALDGIAPDEQRQAQLAARLAH
jgi:aminoglycoside phosphotransferase (APT) family kinase protein